MLFVDRLLRDEAAVQRPGEKKPSIPIKMQFGMQFVNLGNGGSFSGFFAWPCRIVRSHTGTCDKIPDHQRNVIERMEGKSREPSVSMSSMSWMPPQGQGFALAHWRLPGAPRLRPLSSG